MPPNSKGRMASIFVTLQGTFIYCFPANEIAALRREALAFQAVRQALLSSRNGEVAKMVFQKVRLCHGRYYMYANLF